MVDKVKPNILKMCFSDVSSIKTTVRTKLSWIWPWKNKPDHCTNMTRWTKIMTVYQMCISNQFMNIIWKNMNMNKTTFQGLYFRSMLIILKVIMGHYFISTLAWWFMTWKASVTKSSKLFPVRHVWSLWRHFGLIGTIEIAITLASVLKDCVCFKDFICVYVQRASENETKLCCILYQKSHSQWFAHWWVGTQDWVFFPSTYF